MAWQKPVRIAVALIGLAAALAVYLAMGERQVAPPPQPVVRSDPKAIIEIDESVAKQFSGTSKDFQIKQARTYIYDDGSIKAVGDSNTPLLIEIPRGEARTFRIAAREATISKDKKHFELDGPVRLEDTDGFWIDTAKATVNDTIAYIPGAAKFGKGRMTGSGVGFSYDESRQVLLIAQKAEVKTVDEAGKVVMQLTSGTAVLDRMQHVLTADTGVHVIRNEQLIDTDYATSRLGPNNDIVTFIELHGNSRVAGGAPIEALAARDISLDYTDDGKTLEAMRMAGRSSAAMAGESGKTGLRIAGETVDLTLAADGKLTGVVARQDVRLELPASGDAAAQTITSQTLDGTGQAGKGLTGVTFSTNVTFIEPLRPKGTAAEKQGGNRTARAQKLEASLADNAVTSAVFTGDTTFEETGLKACAAQAEYQPEKGTLKLAGETKSGDPMVAEEQVAVEAKTIDVTLDTRVMNARGGMTMWMRSRAVNRCRPATQRSAKEQGASNVPRLLKEDAPVTIVAPSMDYDSKTGRAEFFGGKATLEQEQTSISGQKVVIDQTKGDLLATGQASAQLPVDNKLMTTKADEIRYSDEKRQLVFSSLPKPANSEVSLRPGGPDSSLFAGRVEVTLGAKDNTMERMRAVRNVRVVEGAHNATGGTLDYTAATEEYVMKAEGTTPAVAFTRDGEKCQEHKGNSITFYKGNTQKVSVVGGTSNALMNPSQAACKSPR